MKTKAHIRYRNANNKVVPGVTTILGVLNKPKLVKWANNLGLQGIDSSKYVSETAEIGTLAHEMIMCYFANKDCDTSDYSSTQIDKAENSLLSFFEWEKNHKIEPIYVEVPFVSEKYQYGGTIDLLALIDNELTLVDFKTGSGIYEEAHYQIAAYKGLLIEHDYNPSTVRILNIPRDESESFQEVTLTDLTTEWQIFYHCMRIHQLRKKK